MGEVAVTRSASGRYDEVFVARMYHGVVALAAVLGLVLQVIAMLESPAYALEPAHQWWNYLGYFSVQASVLVFIVSLSLLMDSAREAGPVWRAVRAVSLIAVLLVFLFQFTAFRGLPDFTALSSTAVMADRMLNYAVPVLAVTGWLIFGPRPRIGLQTIVWSLLYPAAWLIGSLVRGAAAGWYPYPPLDAGANPLPAVVVNGLLLLLIWLGAGFLFMLLDARMGREPDGYVPGFGPDDGSGTDEDGVTDSRKSGPGEPPTG
ncbi:Pr6Pr family membrane protein [Arthrobacter crystallopoietes]|uniref:Pr6Pr family membrane protein n=1 Tax=Crystallibacter crystallopoietes TaxID=37928 RepID=UPI0011110020|nr:Pr6Pr family membrane protein [Arthrobacter crystallopoietes]